MRALAPGLLVVAAGTAVALLATLLPVAVSALLVALVVGALLRNLRLLPPTTAPGLAWASRRLLRLGVVLLGLQLSVPAVLALGADGVLVVVVTVVVTAVATLAAGRLLGVPPGLRLLVAAGFSICGAAAVAAMAAVVDPDGEREEDTATAVALVTLFGTLALVVVPAAAALLGFDDAAAGLWIGASVHEVAQVVAAGGAVSAAALAVATVTKLGRVVLLAPLVAVVGLARRSSGSRAAAGRDGRDGGSARARPPLVPLFVVGFLAAVALRATGWLPDVVLGLAATASTVLLAAAMVGLGTGVDVRRLVRTGGPAAGLGAVATAVGVVVAGVLVAATS